MKDNQFNPQNQSESSDFAWFTQASTIEQVKMLLDFPMIIKQILENLMQKVRPRRQQRFKSVKH
jgi:hypothetical protein